VLGEFHASTIVNDIYDILDAYETEGLDLYNFGATDAIADYLTNYVKVEFQLACSEWPNEEGGVCSVAFVDNGHPQLVMFDYKYST
jgi:hypothetical protein